MSDVWNHEADAWDSLNDRDDFDDEDEPSYQYRAPRAPRCDRCGSTDVRWRHQTGQWTLFSMEPGKLHVCPITDDFEVVP